jgi:phage-related minor tail protein
MAIANDSFGFLETLGTNMGNFMSNLVPGLTEFMILIAIVGGAVGLITAIIYAIKKVVSGIKMN